MSICLIIRRENGAKTGVHRAEHNRVGHDLSEATRAGREREKHAGGEEDEENYGNEDVGVEHLSLGT